MRAALEVELLKLRRAGAARVATAAVVVGVPGLSAMFMAVARGAGDSLMAAKVEAMLLGDGWSGYLGVVGQATSVAMLLAVGVVVSWSFGREHVDGTFGALFALPTARRDVAVAKAVVLVAWGLLLCAGVAVLAVVCGLVVGLGPPDGTALAGVGQVAVVGGLTVLLALPLAWVAGVTRGYLSAVGALLGLVVATQVVTVLGAGAWFPWAAPGMWAGMGGAELAATVRPEQLALAVPVGLLGVWATASWWTRAEVR